MDTQSVGIKGKLNPLFSIQNEILKGRAGTSRYEAAMPHGPKDIHQERMKPCYDTIEGKKIPLMYFKPHQEIPHSDTFVVDKILNHRKNRKEEYLWLVSWQGYDAAHNTWEPAKAFIGDIQRDWVD